MAPTEDVATAGLAEGSLAGRSLWRDAARRLWRDRVAMICLAVVAAYAVLALVAPWVWPDWATTYNYDQVYESPSLRHLLGTDERELEQVTSENARRLFRLD